MWYIINKQKIGSYKKSDPNIVSKIGTEKVTNLRIVTDMLNSFFIGHAEPFVAKSKNHLKECHPRCVCYNIGRLICIWYQSNTTIFVMYKICTNCMFRA